MARRAGEAFGLKYAAIPQSPRWWREARRGVDVVVVVIVVAGEVGGSEGRDRSWPRGSAEGGRRTPSAAVPPLLARPPPKLPLPLLMVLLESAACAPFGPALPAAAAAAA